MPAAPADRGVGLLRREIREPESLQRAGDWAMAAFTLVVLEWRACLVWAVAFGLPYSFLALLTGAEHGRYLEVSWVRGFAAPFAIFLALEPLAGGAAYRFLEARAAGKGLSLAQATREAAARLLPLAALLALVEVPVQAVGWLLTRAFSGGFFVGTFVLLAGYAVHAATLTAPPLVALEGLGPLAALRTSLARARSRLPVYALAYVGVGLVHGALWALVSSADAMADSAACGESGEVSVFCSVWWRLGYQWLRTATTAPFYALAFIAHVEAGSPSSAVLPAETRPNGRVTS